MTATTSTLNGADPAAPTDAGALTLPGVETPAGELYDRFMELLPRVRNEIRQLDGQRDVLNAERQEALTAVNTKFAGRLAEIDATRKKLNGLLKAMGEEPESPPMMRTRKGTTIARVGTVTISPKVLVPLIEIISRQGNEKFTVLGILEKIGGSEPPLRNAFNYLRQAEYIGKAGKEDRPMGRQLWRILDPAIGEQLLETFRGGTPNSSPPTQTETTASGETRIESGIGLTSSGSYRVRISVGGRQRNQYAETLEQARVIRDELMAMRQSGESPSAAPSRSAIDRHVAAMKKLNRPTFSAIDIQEVLGLASPRNTYVVFRYLTAKGYLAEAGREGDGSDRTARMLYRIANDDALTTPTEES